MGDVPAGLSSRPNALREHDEFIVELAPPLRHDAEDGQQEAEGPCEVGEDLLDFAQSVRKETKEVCDFTESLSEPPFRVRPLGKRTRADAPTRRMLAAALRSFAHFLRFMAEEECSFPQVLRERSTLVREVAQAG